MSTANENQPTRLPPPEMESVKESPLKRRRHHRHKQHRHPWLLRRRLASAAPVCLVIGIVLPILLLLISRRLLVFSFSIAVCFLLTSLALGLVGWKYSRAKIAVLGVVLTVIYAAYLWHGEPAKPPELPAPAASDSDGPRF